MATIETITIGSDTFSVYSHPTTDPVADSDTYLAAKIGSNWSTATTLQKQQALVSAARFMDRAVNWSGEKTVAAQPREWPRDGANCGGESVTDGTTPDPIAFGQFEMADQLFLDSTVQDGTGTGSNVKKVKAGSAEVAFFSPTLGSAIDTRLPTAVNDLVSCYIEGATIVGGSFGTSDADGDPGYCKDDFDLSQGNP